MEAINLGVRIAWFITKYAAFIIEFHFHGFFHRYGIEIVSGMHGQQHHITDTAINLWSFPLFSILETTKTFSISSCHTNLNFRSHGDGSSWNCLITN
jgi:hypothetical protein